MKSILFTIIDGKVKPVRIDHIVGGDLIIMKVGDEKHPIDPEELDMISNELKNFDKGKFIVCPHNVKIETINPSGKLIKVNAEKKYHKSLETQLKNFCNENYTVLVPFNVGVKDKDDVLEIFIKK